MMNNYVIEIKDLVTQFGDTVIHDHLSMTITENRIVAIIGGSGSGKTTLLKAILMLNTPVSGSIKLFGTEILDNPQADLQSIRQRWGVMFQSGALFSGLSVLENVCFSLKEFTQLPDEAITELAYLKLKLTQYPLDEAKKYPSEISGGMMKRAAMARALALDPELLFLDEHTAGLDPVTANGLDELVISLKESLGLSIVMITHDLDTLWRVSDEVAFIGEKKVLAQEPIEQLVNNSEPEIRSYFDNERARRAVPNE